METQLAKYTQQSFFTHPGQFLNKGHPIPIDIAAMVRLVQHNLIHAYWLEKYGVSKPFSERFGEMQLRTAQEIFAELAKRTEGWVLDDKPEAKRVIGICRDFSLLLCSLLRHHGIPARLRCGFACYLRRGKWEDHWICEYWHTQQQRWIKVDPQLDGIHQQVLKFDFDPLDLPDGIFLTAGEMWQAVREGKVEAKRCGIMQLRGTPYLKANLVRDLFALTSMELLAWDCGWGMIEQPMHPIASESEWQLLDELARMSANSDSEMARYCTQHHQAICLPEQWCWSQAPTIAQLFDRASEELY
ncbi:TPA: transglutaminase domain-containing protein [Vibrio vulnificus]|nr:transglutaminase domain-containing protein [Vibrio vulnificus]